MEKYVDPDGGAFFFSALTERFVYDGLSDDVLYRYNAAGAKQNRYVHGPAVDMLLADESSSDGWQWPLQDHEQTVRDLWKASTGTKTHANYNAFGKTVGPALNELFGYTGQQQDAETGLSYYNQRYYDPASGRFLNEDPSGFSGGDVNLYRYVGNDPVNGTDPSGLQKALATLQGGVANVGWLQGGNTGAAWEQAKQYVWDVGSTAKGYFWNGPTEVISGAFSAAAHPIQTVKGLFNAVLHPVQAATAIKNDIVAKSQTAEGQGQLGFDAATAVFSYLKAGQAAKVARIVDKVVPDVPVSVRSSVIYVTPKGVAVSSKTLARQGSSYLAGNFSGLAGRSVEDIVSRVPSTWKMVPQERGVGIRFLDDAGYERIRIHGPSVSAPAGSNSASGWVLRVMDRAGNYFDDSGRMVPFKANNGHIPIQGNPYSP